MNRVIRVMTTVLVVLSVFALVVVIAGCDNPTSSGDDETETPDNGDEVIVYEIGDLGPAGGWIFYVDENNDFEWTYLEAAPADIVEGTDFFVWSNVAISGESEVGTSTDTGTGLANTLAIVDQDGHTQSAAQWCLDYEVNGYDDWFLPSRDELNLMYENLHSEDIGSFETEEEGDYWSSSEHHSSGEWLTAWAQYFATGSQEEYDKGDSIRVRAARAF